MAKPWEQPQEFDEDDYDPDDYCVKIGRWIPGGCQEEICEDVDKCPYAKKLREE